ncbi:DUF3278 domain-containing protein [Ligilactobacillus saerimneri]|uniref:DUF3278 domain-containing protein n=1 Tax=Ligilactobacillus saerimneri TaxID=228229 RepID=UPI0024B13CAD|nr:DUF3278 domain-containing protein [Ligilactobacillus saerimneri]MDI9206092.1 DUF3278 domain-containing protein [Ligilactobacillus saerimneri]
MTQTTLFTRIIKHFYGIAGPLDEYRLKELNRIGNTALLPLLFLQMAGAFGAILATAWQLRTETVLLTYIWFNMIVFLTVMAYLGWAVGRLHLTEREVTPAEKKRVQLWALIRTLIAGLWFTVSFHLLSTLIDWVGSGQTYSSILLRGRNLLGSLVAGGGWTVIMLIIALRRIKEVNEE